LDFQQRQIAIVVGSSNSRTRGVIVVATWEPSQNGGFFVRVQRQYATSLDTCLTIVG
jgi:hypothetical protein